MACEVISIEIPMTFKKRGGRKVIVVHLSEKSTAVAEEVVAPAATDAAAPAADAEKKDA